MARVYLSVVMRKSTWYSAQFSLSFLLIRATIGKRKYDGLPGECQMSLSIIEYVGMFAGMHKQGVWDRLLAEGELFSEFNREYSENFQQEHNARMKQCFYNAQKCALFSLFKYYEGYALSLHGIPIHHAWLVDDMNQVIDPTWPDMPYEVQYFGIHYPTSEIFSLWDRTETAQSLLYHQSEGVLVNW